MINIKKYTFLVFLIIVNSVLFVLLIDNFINIYEDYNDTQEYDKETAIKIEGDVEITTLSEEIVLDKMDRLLDDNFRGIQESYNKRLDILACLHVGEPTFTYINEEYCKQFFLVDVHDIETGEVVEVMDLRDN